MNRMDINHRNSKHPRRGGPHGRGRGPRGDRGFGPGGPGFGPGFGGPRGGGFGGPRRGRRGDVRRAILALLTEEPMNGYGIITAIAERSDATWQPGPGSIYPALRALEEEGLIAPDESDDDARRKVFALTDDGRAYAAEHADELSEAFAAATTPQRGFRELRQEVHALHGAIQQVGMTGRTESIEAAREALAEARRAIYRILAEDDGGTGNDKAAGDKS
ncbi:PadR family transcriptional regulator [Knoellia koreensis]|uniref:PadR family transcriptional regulator n=1 Tax=Knoellia koreensis TaxID=2730921 RepID=A0A849HEW5_9MICO|nr:PadR family transcriptional regulator [Knoellia sp. DB2414S]NNM45669.1 PadR family transcriptional regulator [Knoellia sp. DB2414S]